MPLRLTLPMTLALGLAACVVQVYPQDSLPTRPWPETASCPTPDRAQAEADVLLDLMNGARKTAGLHPLTLDP